MSHFIVGVILPKGHPNPNTNTAHTESTVEELLANYDENMEVDPHIEKCGCIGLEARQEVTKEVEMTLGTFEQFREKYHNLPKEKQIKWQHWIKPYTELEKRLLKIHPLRKKPMKSCSDCKGTGKYESHYNPDSKWDWWEIGGRWTGNFGMYDAQKDPKNYEPCNICNGTGMRNDQIGIEARKADPKYTCNACSGTGKTMKWRLEWPDKDNTAIISDFLKLSDVRSRFPFAVVTPDGVWHEKGEMGWFGMSHNNKEEKKWVKEVQELLDQHKDHWIIGVDCHI